MVDTHTHLYLPEFGDDGGISAVDRAVAAGVSHMILPNVDLQTVEPLHRLGTLKPEVTSIAMGLHPTEVKEGWRDMLDEIMSYYTPSHPYIAVGEIGLDLYWDKTYEKEQMQAFESQLILAKQYNLPVIIHCREALPQTLEVIQGVKGIRGVMHSFGGSTTDVEAVRKIADMYFGINGIVTFKNSGLRNVLPTIGIERILLETDSPYLAPVPHRGKRNESAYLPHICTYVSDILGIPPEETDRQTSLAAKALFNLQDTCS